jgi:peptidoglycan-associated lipoprotein
MMLPVIFFTASCSKKAVQTEPVVTAEPEVREAPEEPAREAKQAPEPEEERLWEDVAAREAAERAFLEENVHFAFDSFLLSDQARQVLYGKADYLRANPDIAVTVEGHCDDRGTDAYNIALGERRAESVTTFLVNQGIDTDRLDTVSYGEEQPIATEDSEASWARNRRAQFVIN